MQTVDNVELYLLKLFFQPEFYQKYNGFLRTDFLKSNSPILGRVFACLDEYYEKFGPVPLNVDDLEVYYLSLYPASTQSDRELLGKLCANLKGIAINEQLAEVYVRAHLERSSASDLAILALQVADGKEPYSKLVENSKTLESLDSTLEEDFVTDDLNQLLTNQLEKPGLRWRLKTLNQMLGSLRQGDFGFIFKRPETGGTTLLASEVTCMASQAERPVLWINNEEQGEKVKLRCFEAYFGKPIHELNKNRSHYAGEYLRTLGGKILIRDRAFSHRRDVEKLCQSVKPSLIIFDQIDKIKGFDDDRDDLSLKAIYQWARELSKNYGPVIGVCQASVSAEGKQYLTMDDVDRSKTAKQGEADWILGIGKSHQEGLTGIRFLNVCKNKLIGDSDSDASNRHGKAAVRILPDIARYEDIK